jgi:hypothetical protein
MQRVQKHNPPQAAALMPYRVWNKMRTREHFTAGSWWQTQQSVTPFNTFMVAMVTGLSFFYCSLANKILGVFYCLRLDSNAESAVIHGQPIALLEHGCIECTVIGLHNLCLAQAILQQYPGSNSCNTLV